MVIVTPNQYILATKIHHVTLQEDSDWVDVTLGRKTFAIKEYKYTINVTYTPDNQANANGRDERAECAVTIRNKVSAYKVYKELVNQIREQMPDALFLDKALENFLNQDDMAKIQMDQDLCKKEEDEIYDRIANALRGTRKAKRKRKKVLRRPKRVNRKPR